MNTQKKQKGISLIITVLIVAVMLAAVLSLAVILVRQGAVTARTKSSFFSFYAADAGVEKTLFFNNKRIPPGGRRGLCSICTTCADCSECVLSPLGPSGCNPTTCNNCRVTYRSTLDGKTFEVNATISGTDLLIHSKGLHQNTIRAHTLDSTKP